MDLSFCLDLSTFLIAFLSTGDKGSEFAFGGVRILLISFNLLGREGEGEVFSLGDGGTLWIIVSFNSESPIISIDSSEEEEVLIGDWFIGEGSSASGEFGGEEVILIDFGLGVFWVFIIILGIAPVGFEEVGEIEILGEGACLWLVKLFLELLGIVFALILGESEYMILCDELFRCELAGLFEKLCTVDWG